MSYSLVLSVLHELGSFSTDAWILLGHGADRLDESVSVGRCELLLVV